MFTYVIETLAGIGEAITKRIRRRGKKLVKEPYIAITNEHNEFCKAVVQRDTPFRSASSDVAQNWGRCNVDFQFMPRTLDPDHFMESSAGPPAVLQVNPKDALAMYGVRMQMPDAPMLRRAFHALVAMFQAAHNCDFYITKYHAKPMEQMQSLLTNIALGLRRLEAEKEVAEESAEQPKDLPEERARRTILKIANAANRSSWCSCCEMATFIKTGALVRKTHRPIVIFLSRPLYLYEQCRRLLQNGHETLIEAKDTCDEQARDVDALCFTTLKKDSAVQPVSNPADDSDVETSAGNHPDESDADNSEGGSAHILQEEDADSEDIEDDVEQAGSVRNDVEQAEGVHQIPQTLDDDAKA